MPAASTGAYYLPMTDTNISRVGHFRQIVGRNGQCAIFSAVPEEISTPPVGVPLDSRSAGQPPEEKDNDAARVSRRAR